MKAAAGQNITRQGGTAARVGHAELGEDVGGSWVERPRTQIEAETVSLGRASESANLRGALQQHHLQSLAGGEGGRGETGDPPTNHDQIGLSVTVHVMFPFRLGGTSRRRFPRRPAEPWGERLLQ